jgi:hypothetical protein
MSKYKTLLKEQKTSQKPPKNLGRGNSHSTPYLDHYRNLRKPNIVQLIESYKRTAYACANINAAGVVRNPLKLYVKTSGGQKAPRVTTKALDSKKIDYLTENYVFKSVKNIEEVVEHPLLDTLHKANKSIWLNGVQLFLLTQLYQEVTGKAYWHVKENLFGLPDQIWVYPSYALEPVNQNGSTNIVDYYELNSTNGKEKIPVEEIVTFLLPNLLDPYANGRSPLEAGFEANLIGNKLVSHENAMLDNRARIDMLVTPDKDSAIGYEEARRLEKELIQRFGSARGYGVYVADEALNFEPMTYAPSDIAQLQMFTVSHFAWLIQKEFLKLL